MSLANPVLNAEAFKGTWAEIREHATTMTVAGTAIKALGLLAIAFGSAAWAWYEWNQGAIASPVPLMVGGAIVGLIIAFVTTFNPRWSPVTAPIYAAAEGVFLGMFSLFLAEALAARGVGVDRYGLVYNAVGLTFGVFLVMLLLYATRLVRVTGPLVAAISAATFGIVLVYLAQMVLGMFGAQIPGIFGSGMIGIGFSVFVVGIAAFNLLLDFATIEQGAERGAPRYMEWYCAFGLMVTLVWLYIEILNLLMKLQRRRD
jgi:uncharacterized YccA/Bax inhibitor family protein